LETAYAETLVDAGFWVDHTWRWGSASVLCSIGDGTGRHALTLEQQLALNPKIRSVAWAIATHRVRTTRTYLVGAERIKASCWPPTTARSDMQRTYNGVTSRHTSAG